MVQFVTVAFIVIIIAIVTVMSIVVIMTLGRTFGTVVGVIMVMVVFFPTRFIINGDIRFPVDAAIVWIGSDITSRTYAYSS
jgi:hypothetical protein